MLGPTACSIDTNNNVYVATGGNSVVKMLNGNVVQTWTGFSTPKGIAIDNNNNVYIGNSGTNLISVITSAGVLTLNWFTTPGGNPSGLAFNPTSQLLYMATAGTIYTNIISVVGGVGTSLQTNWNGNSPINSAGIAVDPVQGAVYISDSTANYYISKNYVPCGSLPTTPTNGAVGTCVSLMDQGSQCQFTCNTGYSLVGTSTLCAGTSLFPQTCGLGCSAVTPPINGGLGTCTSPLAAGGYCSVVCNTGYAPSLAFSSCNSGVLTAQTCNANCVVTAPLLGTLGTCPSSLPAGSSCNLACSTGYTLYGTSTSCSAVGVLTVQTCGTQNLGSTSWSSSFSNFVYSLATDASGNLYGPLFTLGTIARWTGVITLTSQVPTIWYSGTIASPWGVCFDNGYQNLYVTSNSVNTITKIPLVQNTLVSGTATVWAQASAGLLGPTACSIDTNNNVYVATGGNSVVKMLNGNVVQTWTGFSTPKGIAIDNNNNVYIGNSGLYI